MKPELKETRISIQGKETTEDFLFKRVPKGLKLYMDGVVKAVIEEETDSEFVDMMDHIPAEAENTPLASSFKLLWDLSSENVIRPVGLRRVTIGYAHEGPTTYF